ncbi:MAG: hypothetical protein U0457_19065 [Candidatus Sericytochromatia bacterium]
MEVNSNAPKVLAPASTDNDDSAKKAEAKKQDDQRKTEEQRKKQREDEILNPVDKSLIDRSSLGKNIADSIISAVLG